MIGHDTPCTEAVLFVLSMVWLTVLQDREKTVNDITTFLNTKIAPKDFADELKVASCLLYLVW